MSWGSAWGSSWGASFGQEQESARAWGQSWGSSWGDSWGQEESQEEQLSGGWLFLNEWEAEQRRRRAKAKKRRELEEETEQIQDELDRAIAQELRKQEALDEKRDDLNRLSELAKRHADLEAARRYSERVATAFARAIAQENFSALEALDRELQRAAEEEEFLLLSLMMLVD